MYIDIITVLGERLLPNGTMPLNFELKMARGLQLLAQNKDAILLVSGGVTRAGLPSEAQAAMRRFVPIELSFRVLLEERSQSTTQNVQFTKEMLARNNISVKTMIVVSSRGQWERADYLFKRWWPELRGRISCSLVGDDHFRTWAASKILYCMTRIDPKERFFLPIRKFIFTRSFS